MEASRNALVVSAIDGASHSYRAEQLAKSLTVSGLNVRVFGPTEVDHAHNVLLHDQGCGLVALVRSPLAGPFADIVEVARSRTVPVLADFDDLVFRDDVFNKEHIDGLRYLSDAELGAYRGAVPLYRAMVAAADVCTTSTRYLASQALEVGARRSVTVPNVFTHAQEALSIALREERELRAHPTTTMGYASGSMTHQCDFASAASSIAEILAASRSRRLLVTGELDLDEWPVLRPHRSQISQEGLRTLGELPFVYAQYDIALAPLQLSNPFTDAKSVLKFIDAALVGVPTVASPTESFCELTGGTELLLARTPGEWTEALTALCEDDCLRAALAKAALERVLEEFSPSRHASVVGDLLADLGVVQRPAARGVPPTWAPRRRVPSRSPRGAKLVWVVPPPEPGSGGAGSIFRMARELMMQGLDSLVLVTGADRTGHAAQYSNEFGIEVVYEYDAVPDEARRVATHWPTAWSIASCPTALRPVYFIQDYEPLFYPMSYDRLRAQGSYGLPFHHVYYGPWAGSKVPLPPGVSSITIDFPIDPEFVAAHDAVRDHAAIAFLSRPDMPRRCYDFSASVLLGALDRRPEMTVHSYGSLDAPRLRDHPRVIHHGYLPKTEMARLLRSCALGLAISTTNPSAVPYEMMACGCIPIDLQTEVAPSTYRGCEDVPLLLPLDPEDATDMLVQALADPADADRRRTRAFEQARKLPSPAETAAAFATFLKRLPD